MRYWLFQNNQVLGPYEPDALRGLRILTPDTLVCPEGRKGTSMGDWQKAGLLSELLPVLAAGAPAAAAPAPAPRDPELEDALKELPRMRGLPQKLDALEGALRRLEGDLSAKDAALEELRRETGTLKTSPGGAADLERRLAALEARLTALGGLDEAVDGLRAISGRAERGVEAHGAALAELRVELAALREQWAALPAPSPAAPPVPVVDLEPLAPAPSPPPPAAAEPAPKPRSRKALIIGAALGSLLLLVLLLLLSSGPKRGGAPDPEETDASAAASQAAAAPEASSANTENPLPAAPEPAPDPRQAAIEVARTSPLPDGGTLGAALERLSPAQGRISPWMAEPLSADRLQVNYFARGAAAGAPTVAYEFEVDLTLRSVIGRNAAAKAVLSGAAAAPAKTPKRKAVKVKPKRRKNASAKG